MALEFPILYLSIALQHDRGGALCGVSTQCGTHRLLLPTWVAELKPDTLYGRCHLERPTSIRPRQYPGR